ncbi:AcvB/VirJ family lysyl-phosphatidylglycerol hydrolase [Zavarzinia compransoris]|nr:AcvB/VirJ family lysyl-phosphatidylglycerol hydrolase [Zavarzinia compransoris]
MILLVLALVAQILAGAASARADDGALDAGLLARARLLPALGETRAVAILISDREGWDERAMAVARLLTQGGVLVIGIDLPAALARMGGEGDACVSPQWSAQDVSHEAQRRLDLPAYDLPWLAGIGEGATLALNIARQARAATFAGVVAVDAEPARATDKPVCPPTEAVDIGGAAVSSQRRGFVDAVHAAAGLPGVKPGKISLPPGEALAVRLLQEVEKTRPGDGTAALPVTELPAAPAHGFLAIVYSGDGGWRDLDKDVAQYFQDHGVPTVGLDMLRYFWSRRSAAEAAADLAHLITHYRRVFGADKVVLVGYSFGADLLPALYNLLPPEVRGSVFQLSLLGLSDKTSFEVTIGEFLGGNDDTAPTRPEIARIPAAAVQCLQGRDDEEAICGSLAAGGVEVVVTEGSHHFDGDYGHLAEVILAGALRRLGLPAQ